MSRKRDLHQFGRETAVRPPHAMGVMHQVLAAQDSQGHGSESQHEMHQMQETQRSSCMVYRSLVE